MSIADYFAIAVHPVMTHTVDVVQKAAHILEVTEGSESNVELTWSDILNEKGELFLFPKRHSLFESAAARTECFLFYHFSNFSEHEIAVSSKCFTGWESRSFFFFLYEWLFFLFFFQFLCVQLLPRELFFQFGSSLE